jgi:hypothetical protein
VPNRSEINTAMPLPQRSSGVRKQPPIRPELLFAGAVMLVAGVAMASTAMLPSDLVMPVVVSTLLFLAAALGSIGGRFRNSNLQEISCRDVAGALTLIGAFAATAIEAEQLMRLLASH